MRNHKILSVSALFAVCFLLVPAAWGRARTFGYCQAGNQTVTVLGYASSTTTPVMRSYPACTVKIYAAGTLNLANIFADNIGTVRANPFTADNNGYYFFYADDGRYDILISGTQPSVTVGDVSSFDPLTSYTYSGVMNRALTAKLADWISVKDFGCVGDGVADDSNCLKNATAAAITAKKSNYCPAGFYKTTSTVTVTLPAPTYANGGSQPYAFIGDGSCTIQVASTDGSGGMEIKIPPSIAAYQTGGLVFGVRFMRDPVATGNPAFALKLTNLAQFEVSNLNIFVPPVNVTNAFAKGLWLNGSQQGEVHGSEFAYNTIGIYHSKGQGTGVQAVGGPNDIHGNMLIGSTGQTCFSTDNVDTYFSNNNMGSCDTGIALGPNSGGYILQNHFELHTVMAFSQTGNLSGSTLIGNQFYQGTLPGINIVGGVSNIQSNRIDGSVTFGAGACTDITYPSCTFNFNKNTYNPIDNTSGKLTMFGNQPTGLTGSAITTPTLLNQPIQINNPSTSSTNVAPQLTVAANPNINQDIYMTLQASGTGFGGIAVGAGNGPGIVSSTSKSFLDIDSAVGTTAGSTGQGTNWARFAATMSYIHTPITMDATYNQFNASAGANYLGWNYNILAGTLSNAGTAGWYMGNSIDGANRFALFQYPVGGPARYSWGIDSHNFIQGAQVINSALVAPDNGNSAYVYCTDCTVATPCTGAGPGAWAFWSKATQTWKCPF